VSVYAWLRILRLIHIYSAIVLVGAIIFNTGVLMPALKRVPPAQAAVVGQRIGAGLLTLGTTAIVLLGATGFTRLWLMGEWDLVFSARITAAPYQQLIALMALAWLLLAITGTLSGIWYRRILMHKMPYSAGLHELEQRRAAQARVNLWQDRLAWANLVLALTAVLGGALAGY